MSTTKHTPGEWAAKESIVYSLETGQDIARCDIGGRDEQTEANSKLIAAAPDLLKALTELHNLLDEHEPNWYLKRHDRTALTAINKAIGE